MKKTNSGRPGLALQKTKNKMERDMNKLKGLTSKRKEAYSRLLSLDSKVYKAFLKREELF